MRYLPICLILVMACWSQAATFQGLGAVSNTNDSWSVAYGVSPDGKVVVGTSNGNAFRWQDGQMQSLGSLTGDFCCSAAYAASENGSKVVGWSTLPNPANIAPFQWTSDESMALLDDQLLGTAQDISANGDIVVGRTASEAYLWTTQQGIQLLGDLPGGLDYSHALAISPEGSTVVGYSESSYGLEAFRWTQTDGMSGLGDLDGGDFRSLPHDVSASGEVVVGLATSLHGTEAFRYQDGRMIGLADLPGGSFYSEATAVSDDGSVIVGFSDSGSNILGATNSNVELGVEAVIWENGSPIRKLQDVFENDYALDLDGWTLIHAHGVSSDGQTIVGDGLAPDGHHQGWIATIPEPTSIVLFGLGSLILRKTPRKKRRGYL